MTIYAKRKEVVCVMVRFIPIKVMYLVSLFSAICTLAICFSQNKATAYFKKIVIGILRGAAIPARVFRATHCHALLSFGAYRMVHASLPKKFCIRLLAFIDKRGTAPRYTSEIHPCESPTASAAWVCVHAFRTTTRRNLSIVSLSSLLRFT
jgi:hypothetical protein